MSTVEIQFVVDRWVLLSTVADHTFYLHSDARLVEVLSRASLLGLHVSNLDQLPLKQYLVG